MRWGFSESMDLLRLPSKDWGALRGALFSWLSSDKFANEQTIF